MTLLRECVTDYLSVRRALGFQLTEASHLLTDFVGFLERAGATTLTTQLAVTWATQTEAGMNRRSARLSIVRGFARYLQAIEPSTEIPPANLLPRGSRRAIPYIYTEAEVSALLAATQTLGSPAARWLLATLIGLLSATGMRLGEAVGLDRDDLDWAHGILTVRKGKFGKSREVPLHETTMRALGRYGRWRDQWAPHPKGPSFFVSQRGTRPNRSAIDDTFRELARRAGLPDVPGRSRPRLHDFRHSFAVHTLLEWYRDGLDVAAQLPLLSTYLGHVNPSHTYWYLSATPDLLALAAERLEHGHAGGHS